MTNGKWQMINGKSSHRLSQIPLIKLAVETLQNPRLRSCHTRISTLGISDREVIKSLRPVRPQEGGFAVRVNRLTQASRIVISIAELVVDLHVCRLEL